LSVAGLLELDRQEAPVRGKKGSGSRPIKLEEESAASDVPDLHALLDPSSPGGDQPLAVRGENSGVGSLLAFAQLLNPFAGGGVP
jgi:hypothetical protein